jgi:hypothetical protein
MNLKETGCAGEVYIQLLRDGIKELGCCEQYAESMVPLKAENTFIV